MSVTATDAPALPADLEALMRQLKMPYARALAPELSTPTENRATFVRRVLALLALFSVGANRLMELTAGRV